MSTRTAIYAITGNGFSALSVGFCTLRHQTPVKTTLGLNTVVPSNQLNEFLFSQDVEAEDTPPEALPLTGITIILPVYNALDLLPEVLPHIPQVNR